MNKQKHCCKEMNTTLNDENTSLVYSSVFRDYGLLVVTDNDRTTVQGIYYCPWCQTQLPKNCFNLWFQVLKQEYNLDNPRSEEQRNFIPNEFKTDEWWIKRKL
jgi:hypothetical protein